MKRLCYLIIFLTVVAFTSCRHCPELQSATTTLVEKTVYRDTVLKGNTVYSTVQDTGYKNLPIYKVITKRDSGSLAELRYWRDQYGQLQIECQALDRKAQLVDKTSTTSTQKQYLQQVKQPNKLLYLAIISLALLGSLFLIKFNKH